MFGERGGQVFCPLLFILSLFFLAETLVILPQAYDYTLIKFFLSECLALIFLFYFILKKRELFFNRFFIPLFLYYFFILVSLAFSSSPLVSFKQLSVSVVSLTLVLIGANLKEVFRERWVFYVWIISAGIASIWVIWQYSSEGKIVASFGNRNFFAGYIIMPSALLISLFLGGRDRISATRGNGRSECRPRAKSEFPGNSLLLFLILLSLLLFGLYISKSQAAFLGFSASVLFILFHFLRDRIKVNGLTLLLIFCFVFLAAATFFLQPSVSGLVKNIRYPIYTGTIEMIKEKPLTGFGPGKFETSYQEFRPPEYFGREETTSISNHAHNEYLEIAAETGIPSLIFFIIFIASFFFYLNKRLKENAHWYILTGLGAGILAVLVDNLLSTNLRTYSVPPFFYLSIGLASCLLPGQKKISGFFSRFVPVLLVVVILAFIPFGVNELKGEIYYKRGVKCPDVDEAISLLNKSLVYSPHNLNVFYKLGYLYAVSNRPRESLVVYNELLMLSPNFARTHYNIAVVLGSMGEKEEAVRHLRMALKHNPFDEESLCLMRKFTESRRNSKKVLTEER